ncbi:MAG: peptidase [Chlamydia sp. 32-24]|nr:MAG: peptidase [Chlamydia sp. 32-24]
MSNSIIKSSFRALFVTIFTFIGAGLGLVSLLLILGLFSTNSTELEKEKSFKAYIQPNSQGIRKELSKDAPVILKININGVIGMDNLTSENMRRLLTESREGILKDERVKGILLYIQTPGGTVVDADGIFRLLKNYKETHKTPIYAFVDGLCASGGMYIASAADKVFATDVSLIGSVGVLAPSFINVSDLLQKIGVKSLTITAGKGKDDLNPLRPWKEGEDSNYREIIDYYYKEFVNIVTANRTHLNKDKLVEDYGAKVFPSPIAKEYGFIDHVENLETQVIKNLAEELGIHDNYYQVVELQKSSWYNDLFKSSLGFFKGEIKHQVVLPSELNPSLQGKFLYLYQP